ncbi:lantibiotic dehydratase [Chitinophaga nivalis]|uniref:Lantibiotic dehydratase n=1 Tax=Chitinophaga nivalis TaxID=2991709 RepID=A0ABT3IL92_9BACT|nr:lantibiotic dehydratase [Chitinophaga nivalis]MCW3465568.1 lantibiotic dehydratase [Chitinophaga nivalis]MCW3484741.1 lantibiotic dehydratase [Chitinophaga nivalis]
MALSHTGFFLLRTPLYPIGKYKEVVQAGLRDLIAQNPLFSYALYIGSKDLVNELDRFINEPAEFNEKKIAKLRKSLYKYWVRACTRSTPYGLFAGCTLGTIGAETALVLKDQQQARQQVRLDMDYYTRICNHIRELPAVNSELKYYINNSLYKIGDKYRYAEYIINNNRRKYLLTSIADSVFIEKIIRCTADGLTMDAIVRLILEEDDTISEEEATAFTGELVAAQILIPETEPKITGEDNLGFLINRLTSIAEATALRDELIGLASLFEKQDFELSRLSEIHARCEAAFPLTLPKDLLQIDLFKTAEKCTLSEPLMDTIVTQLNNLLALCHGYASGGGELSSFATRFSEQYESQEIPLNMALDGETGIGYGTGIENAFHAPFVEDVATGGQQGATTVTWSPIQALALDKYEQFLRENLSVVTISDEDLKKIGDAKTIKFTESCYLFGHLLSSSPEAAATGDFYFTMQSMGGPSAANLLGRFCSGDTALAEKVKTILEEEAAAYPDAILAEIVHFPEARAGNVLIRPALRAYEIPYVGVSGTDPEFQIPISDLMVSVKQNEIILRSKRLNKRIIPRLSSAHNYSFNSLPIYKFLCDLQHQGAKGGLFWDWGVLGNRGRMPRVVYKNIVLSRASWSFGKAEIEKAGDNPEKQREAIDEFRKRQQLPEKVVIAEADNELFLDLTLPDSIRILIDYVNKSGSVQLKEFMFDEKEGIIRDEQQQVYANEILIPLRFTPTTTRQTAAPFREKGVSSGQLIRSFAPGSEWMYVKIYCGYAVAEELLSGYFAEKIPAWQEEGLFEQFFFIRYADPKPHIRMRFLNKTHHVGNDVILRRLYEDLHQYLLNGQVKKIQCDTYDREIERYGATTMEMSETVFYADSLAVLEILSMLEGAEGEMYRWKIAMRGVDMLLDDFNLPLQQKKQVLSDLQKGYTEEFGGPKLLHKQLNDKYRKHQKEIASFMNPEDDETNEIAEVINLYRQRSDMTSEAIAAIREAMRAEEEGGYKLSSLIMSYIHMFLNRIFVAKQRKHELVLYHFLEKFYLSQIALVELAK